MEPPRQPKDLPGLLKFALQGTKNEDPTTSTAPMSEERKQWLEEALKGMSVNVVEELSVALRTLNPEKVLSSGEDTQAMEDALDIIVDYVDSIDTANGNGNLLNGLLIINFLSIDLVRFPQNRRVFHPTAMSEFPSFKPSLAMWRVNRHNISE